MPQIEILYHPASHTFIGKDEHQNIIAFKEDRIQHEATPITQTTTLSPMTNLLMACGACSAIEIVIILEKQRQAFEGLKLVVSGEREQNKVPALWEKVHIQYLLTGAVSLEKAMHAAQLSVEKYCSVAETLRRAGAHISFEVSVEES